MSYLNKYFVKTRNLSEKVYTKSDYDDTYKAVRVTFKIIGIRIKCNDTPTARFLYILYFCIEMVSLIIALLLETAYVVVTAQADTVDDGVTIISTMPCITYMLLTILKSYKMVLYHPIYENLIDELRDMWPEGRLPKDQDNILSFALKELYIVIKGYVCSNCILSISYFAVAYYNVAKRAFGYDVPRQLPFHFWFWFDAEQPVIYEIMLVIQNWQTRHSDMIDKEGSEDEHFKELVAIAKKHEKLIRLANDVEELFSFILFINFLFTTIIICFCGFYCLFVEKYSEITYKMFLLTSLAQTWLICWFGQKLVDCSTGIANAIYNSGWYMASKKVRSIMIIILHRSQKQVHITTYGFSTICLASYATIIKSSWSYFTLLLKTYK